VKRIFKRFQSDDDVTGGETALTQLSRVMPAASVTQQAQQQV
jgi:hypothetical protein